MQHWMRRTIETAATLVVLVIVFFVSHGIGSAIASSYALASVIAAPLYALAVSISILAASAVWPAAIAGTLLSLISLSVGPEAAWSTLIAVLVSMTYAGATSAVVAGEFVAPHELPEKDSGDSEGQDSAPSRRQRRQRRAPATAENALARRAVIVATLWGALPYAANVLTGLFTGAYTVMSSPVLDIVLVFVAAALAFGGALLGREFYRAVRERIEYEAEIPQIRKRQPIPGETDPQGQRAL